MLSGKSALVLIVAIVLVASVMFFGAVAPASAQKTIPTPISLTATPTETAFPTATAVPPTATKVPPTATKVPPTATATKVPPTATATKVPPTPTKIPTKAPVFLAPKSGGPPGGGFYTGHTIMNLGTSTANVNVAIYNSANTNTYAISNTVVAGASWTWLSDSGSISPNLPSPFQGSAVVSSDQAVASVVNITNLLGPDGGVSGGTAAEQYDGWDGAKVGTTVAFPLAKNAFGPKTTAFYIQNAGGSAATFTAVFQMGSGIAGPFTPYTYTSPSLNPGQMAVIFPGDTTNPGAVPAGQVGSLTVTSSQNLAGTVLEYETSTSPALILQSTNGVAPSDYDTTLYFPTFKSRFGSPTRSTGLQIQNVTGGSFNVTVTIYGTGGACSGNTYVLPAVSIGPGALSVILEPASVPQPCLGSAKAVGAGNIAATVNESFVPCSGCVQASTTYSAFPAHEATAHIVAPLYKQELNCRTTGLQVQNLSGSTTATATAVFNVSGTTYTLNNISISPNASVVLLEVASSIPPGSSWVGSALPNGSLASVSVTANTNIVGIANEAVMTTVGCSSVLQNKKNYEGFNVTP